MDICIFCNEEIIEKSREHVISEKLGGNLCIDVVCKKDNNLLGTIADSELVIGDWMTGALKALGFDKQYMENLKKTLCYLVTSDKTHKFRATHDWKIRPQEMPDGSRIVHEPWAEAELKKEINKRKTEYSHAGLTQEEIDIKRQELWTKYLEAKAGDIVECPEIGFALKKHSTALDREQVFNPTFPFRAISKMAYEFLYMIIGYDCMNQKYEWLRNIAGGNEQTKHIYQLGGREKVIWKPIHQISLLRQSNSYYFLIDLFDGYHWRVDMGTIQEDLFRYLVVSPPVILTGVGVQLRVETSEIQVFVRDDASHWSPVFMPPSLEIQSDF